MLRRAAAHATVISFIRVSLAILPSPLREEKNVTAAVVALYSDATVVIHLVGFDLKGQSNLHSYTTLRVMYSQSN